MYGTPISLPINTYSGITAQSHSRSVAISKSNSLSSRDEPQSNGVIEGAQSPRTESCKSEPLELDEVHSVPPSHPSIPLVHKRLQEPQPFIKPPLPVAKITTLISAGEEAVLSSKKVFPDRYKTLDESGARSAGRSNTKTLDSAGPPVSTTAFRNGVLVTQKPRPRDDIFDVVVSDSEEPSPSVSLAYSAKQPKYYNGAATDTQPSPRRFSDIEGCPANLSSIGRSVIDENKSSQGPHVHHSTSNTSNSASLGTPASVGKDNPSMTRISCKQAEVADQRPSIPPESQGYQPAGGEKNNCEHSRRASRLQSNESIQMAGAIESQTSVRLERSTVNSTEEDEREDNLAETDTSYGCENLASRELDEKTLLKAGPSTATDEQMTREQMTRDETAMKSQQRNRRVPGAKGEVASKNTEKQSAAGGKPKQAQKIVELEKMSTSAKERSVVERQARSSETPTATIHVQSLRSVPKKPQSITPFIPSGSAFKAPSTLRSSSLSTRSTPSRDTKSVTKVDQPDAPRSLLATSRRSLSSKKEPIVVLKAQVPDIPAAIKKVGKAPSLALGNNKKIAPLQPTRKTVATRPKNNFGTDLRDLIRSKKPVNAEPAESKKISTDPRDAEATVDKRATKPKKLQPKPQNSQTQLAFARDKGKTVVYEPPSPIKPAVFVEDKRTGNDKSASTNDELPYNDKDPGPSRRRLISREISAEVKAVKSGKSPSPTKEPPQVPRKPNLDRSTDDKGKVVVEWIATERPSSKSVSRSPAREVASSATTSSDAEVGSQSDSEPDLQVIKDVKSDNGREQRNSASKDLPSIHAKATVRKSTTKHLSNTTTESDSEMGSDNEELPRLISKSPLTSFSVVNPEKSDASRSGHDSHSDSSEDDYSVADPVEQQVQREIRQSMEPSRSSQLLRPPKTPNLSHNLANGRENTEIWPTSAKPMSSHSRFPSFKEIITSSNPPFKLPSKTTFNAHNGYAMSKTQNVPFQNGVDGAEDEDEEDDDDSDDDSDSHEEGLGKQARAMNGLLKRK